MADELIDIYDENNNFTGVQKMKSEAHRDGLWHRNIHVWIYNSAGEILLQLRAKDKLVFPDVWDVSVAGHVGAGEDLLISASREVEEEIGLKIKTEDLYFFKIKTISMTYKEIKNNEFAYIYFLKFDGDISELKLQDEEVQAIEFFPIDKITEGLLITPDKFLDYDGYWSEIIEEIRKKRID